jgi:hypothetical protein
LIPTGIGTYVLGRALGWWGNKENNNSNTQGDALDVNAMDDSLFE